MLPGCSLASRRRSTAPEHEHPDDQADDQQDLPEAARGRGTRSPAGRTSSRRRSGARRGRQVGADQRPEDDHRQRPEQRRRRACPGACGSRRAIIGARKIPAATNEVATQKIASWTCQVRIRLYGKHAGQVEAEEARRCRRGSAATAAPTSVWSRNSAAITKKNQAVARCAGVSATSPGARNESVACSRPCQPSSRPSARRPRTAARCRRAARSATAPTRRSRSPSACCPTRGSGGQLFVYE